MSLQGFPAGNIASIVGNMGWWGWKPPVEFHVSIFYTCYTMYSIFQNTKYQKVQLQEQRKDILNVNLRVLSLPFQNIIRIHRTSFAFSGHSLSALTLFCAMSTWWIFSVLLNIAFMLGGCCEWTYACTLHCRFLGSLGFLKKYKKRSKGVTCKLMSQTIHAKNNQFSTFLKAYLSSKDGRERSKCDNYFS